MDIDTKGVRAWWKECKVGSGEIYGDGPLSRNSRFGVSAPGVKKESNGKTCGLKHVSKGGLHEKS